MSMEDDGDCNALHKRPRLAEAAAPALAYDFDAPAAGVVHPCPPVPVAARLRAKTTGKSMIEGSIIAHHEHEDVAQRDIQDGAVCTYCFVGRVDANGGMPPVLQKVLFLLHMLQDAYNAAGTGGKKGGATDVRESVSAGGHCVTVGSFRYHRIDDGGIVRTLPLFQVNLFVDEAVTSRTSGRPMAGMYVFCTVQIPQTFNFLQAIQDACSPGKAGRRGAPPGDEMRGLWVDVMQHHVWLGGNRGLDLASAFQAGFADLFDVNSKGYLPAWATPANCVRLARLHMMTEGIAYLQDALGVSCAEAAERIVVRFRHLDVGLAEHFDVNRYDQVWANVARTTMVNFHTSLARHVVTVAQQARDKGGGSSAAANDEYGDIVEGGGNGAPPFEPPAILSLPTSIAWGASDEITDFLTELCAEPASVAVDEVLTFLTNHRDAVAMQGLPAGMMAHTAELGLLWPRQGSPCGSFNVWLQHNHDVAFPSNTSLRILMATHTAGLADSGLYASFMETDSALDPAVRTVEDFRLSLLRETSTATGMIYGRAECFYRAQMRSIAFETDVTRRLRAWSAYLLTVAQPLARTYAAVDSGRFGGRDGRINVFFRLGDLRQHKEGLACRLAGVFRDGIRGMYDEMAGDERWCLGRHRGTLLEPLIALNAVMAWRNGFMCLKKNNLELFFRLVVSGLSFKLSHNKCVIPQAPNHIGTTLWVLDFMGRVLVDHKDGKRQGTQVKTWGCGVDKVEAEYELADHPKTYAASAGLENLAEYPELRDTRNSSDLGLQKTHSVAGQSETLRSVPDRYFCTEIKSNMGSNATGRTEYGKFCDMMARQTRSGAAPSRTTCVKDALGNIVPQTEYGAAYMELLLASSNQETRRDCVHTFAAVVTRCFSGALDTVDSGTSGGAAGAVDLGVGSRFVNQPLDDKVHNGSGWFFLATMAVAQVTASIQMRGLLAVTPTVMDRAVMETLYQLVGHPAHLPYIAPEAGCVSQWSREKEKVESVMPALGLLLHASNAFLKHDPEALGGMKFAEFVHDCTVNWLAAPVPVEILPELHVRLLNQTMDWCFWLLMGIFIDFFQVPTVDAGCLEAFFDGSTTTLPARDADKIRTWLGLQCMLDTDPAAAAGMSLVRQSCMFITTPADPNGDSDANSLCLVNVASTRLGEDTPVLKRACDKFAAKLHARYGARLKNSCNIHNAAALSVMLWRYANRGMPKDRFGAVCTTGKRGWESWHALQRALSPHAAGPSASAKVLDGHASNVQGEVAGASHALYAAPALVCELHEGNEWSFGVEPRFLLWAAAIFGGGNPISQPTLQRVPVHWTQRVFSHRIPASVYPYGVLFGSVPSVQQDGLTVAPLAAAATRPHTMTRSLPQTAVEENNPRMLQAVVDGRMPEDYMLVEAQERLARIVACDAYGADDYQVASLPELSLAALPPQRWVHFVVRRDTEHFAAAAWLNAESRADEEYAVQVRMAFPALGADGDTVPGTQSQSADACYGPTLRSAVAAAGGGHILMRPCFCRPGILVQHGDKLGTLVPWDEPGLGYFDPARMAYKVVDDNDTTDSNAHETSSASVEHVIVPVGAEVLLRLDRPEVANAVTSGLASLVAADRGRRKFVQGSGGCADAVLPAMLLYTLPVKPEHAIGKGVWVGVRHRHRGAATSSYHALFLEVSPDMLCRPRAGVDNAALRRYELCS